MTTMTDDTTPLDGNTVRAILRGDTGALDPDRGVEADDVLLGRFHDLEPDQKMAFWPYFMKALEVLWGQYDGPAMLAAMHFLRRVCGDSPPGSPADPQAAFRFLLSGHDHADAKAEAEAGALGILVDYQLGDRDFWGDRVKSLQRAPDIVDDFYTEQAYTSAWAGFVRHTPWRDDWKAVFESLIDRALESGELPAAELLDLLLAGNSGNSNDAKKVVERRDTAFVVMRGYSAAVSSRSLSGVPSQRQLGVQEQLDRVLNLWVKKGNPEAEAALELARHRTTCTPRQFATGPNLCANG